MDSNHGDITGIFSAEKKLTRGLCSSKLPQLLIGPGQANGMCNTVYGGIPGELGTCYGPDQCHIPSVVQQPLWMAPCDHSHSNLSCCPYELCVTQQSHSQEQVHSHHRAARQQKGCQDNDLLPGCPTFPNWDWYKHTVKISTSHFWVEVPELRYFARLKWSITIGYK